MSTYIDGIGQCQVLDKSGELVDLKGHDISSLDKTGTFTWEHQANSPATLVGKILEAKKIFSKDDCKNERHLYYWNKCKTPYLYVMGELLDDYTASAKECAGQMRYSKDHPDQKPLLGFSIEGSELPGTRKGMIITRSIGRKVTLTQSPCNSACIAEIYEAPEQKSQISDDLDSIFKSKEEAITLFKSGEGVKIYEDFLMKKENRVIAPPENPYNEYENKGIRTGTTTSGKKVASHGHTGSYGFNPAEHQTSGEHHNHASTHADNPKLGDNKAGREAGGANALASGGRKENRAALSLVDKEKIATQQGKQVSKCELHKSEKIGQTSSGKDVHSHKKIAEYDFNPAEHKEAAELHRKAAVNANDMHAADHHIERMKLHNSAALTSTRKENKKGVELKNRKAAALEEGKRQMGKSEPCELHKGAEKGVHEPLFAAGRADTPGIKTGQGMSSMGYNVRNPRPGMVDPKVKAAQKLKEQSKMPKPDLGKAESTLTPKPLGTMNTPVRHRGVKKFANGWTASTSEHPKLGTMISFEHSHHEPVTVHKDKDSGKYHVKHAGTFAGVKGKKGIFDTAKEALPHAVAYTQGISQGKISAPRTHNRASPEMMGKSELKKALEAGSTNAAPSTLVNGAAYQTESLGSKPASTGAEDHQFQGTKKKDWNKQAKDDYERWPHREKFEKFMQARMPHLALGEIQAIGRTIALKKNIEGEKALEDLLGLEKSWKHVAAGAAALGALVGGTPAHAGNINRPDSVKYSSVDHGPDKTPSSKSTLNARKFGPYTITTHLHPTSTIENGVERKSSSLTNQVTFNGTHSPEHAKAVAHELDQPGLHTSILQMNPGDHYMTGSSKHSIKESK